MAFDITQFGLSPKPGFTNWGTLLAVPTPDKPKKTPYKFDGSKAPKGSKPTSTPSDGGSSGGGGGSAAAVVPKKKKKKKPVKKTPAAYNPLTAPFKTPGELRKEAAELAALSVASEESLRQQQALQETGLTGLTTALTNRLSGVSNDYASMLKGLQGTYGNVAAGATSAGESAVAASGAPSTTPVAGANPLMASNFAALGAVPGTYAGSAELTGAQLIGGSKAKLQDALITRANTVSENTAKYLRQLQDTEYNKAIAQVTSEQNAARLGVDAQYKAGQLGVAQSRAATAAGQLARQIEKDKNAGKSSASTIKSVQKGILTNPNTWTEPTYSSSDYEWTFALGDGKFATGIGPNRNAAIKNALDSGSMAANSVEQNKGNLAWGVQGSAIKIIPKYADVQAQLISLLTNAGMTPVNAAKWILKFMPGVARLPR
jgi:hypothetical protein